jgi:hypothetical protein
MRTAYKMLAGNLLAILLMGVLTIGTVTAEDGVHKGGQPEATANSQQAASQSGNNYVFVTPEGGSLSVLARRAVQIFDQENNSISLTSAQSMYIEANVVKELGDRYLEIGEKVSISRDRILALAQQSQSLSTTDTAAWQEYANNVDFNVGSIAPESAPKPDPESDKKSDEQADKKDDSSKKVDQQGQGSSQLPGWGVIAAIAAIGAAVYFLNPNRRVTTTGTTPAERTSRKPAAAARKRKK